MSTRPTALIAEDEPLLAAALQMELRQAWPELDILATVGDGLSAARQALALQPQVLFFDIRMPGATGLEAAADLADAWPQDAGPFPLLVFVTAYDQYAVEAFEAQAVDYLLKPVVPARLQKTVQKLQSAIEQRSSSATKNEADGGLHGLDRTLTQLRQLLAPTAGGAAASAPQLSVIQASVNSAQGATLVMVPVDEVVYFEAADKYVRVLTPEREVLIRTPLKELLPQLNPQAFWQIHRSTVVRVQAIHSVSRDDSGKLHLQLHRRPERLPVSRLYAHLFKAM